VYTSPHLVRFNERFRLGAPGGGRFASDDVLLDALNECERTNGGELITVFEITTAAGFLLFANHPADVLILEVGMGGRLDATNVIERPLATVITPVSLDHAEFLGDTLDKIAAEKAGILKRGVPAVIAGQTPEAFDAIEEIAAKIAAPMRIAGQDWVATEERGRLVYQDDAGLLDLPAPKIFGRHQFENAGVAINALRATPLALPSSAFETGIVRAEWPARMQRLAHGNLAALLPPGAELWLDGGHNPEGGRIIAAALADLEERVPRPVVLVVGMLNTKDCTSFLHHFAGLARQIVAVAVPEQPNSLPAAAIAEAAGAAGLPAVTAESVAAALTGIAALGLELPPRVLIAGSLYLAGKVLADHG
jgi:dihydrofolate synthase/folylpolyglutamate synthase